MSDYLNEMEQMLEQSEAPDANELESSETSPVWEDAMGDEQPEEGSLYEPEQEEERPKRRVRKKKEEQPEDNGPQPEYAPETSDSEPDVFDADEGAGAADPAQPDDDPQGGMTDDGESDGTRGYVPVHRPRRTVTLDSAGNIIREQSVSSSLHDISILTAARNGRRILTATVDAIEEDGNSLPRVVFYVGTVKVLIPFEQMGLDLDPSITSQREARLLIDSMLGAKIDYMVRGIDTEAKIAAASRRDAMLVRQRTILNARGTSREYRIEEGMRVTARVIHVSQYAVRVEVYGFETYVPIGSISNLWVRDIRQFIQVGEERPVEITGLVRGEDGRVTSMQVSIRAAEDVPELELQEGNTYTGHISGFSETAYFVRVKGVPTEVRCPVKSNHTMELLGVGDLVKFYIRGVHDGVPTGAVLKVLKKRIVSEF